MMRSQEWNFKSCDLIVFDFLKLSFLLYEVANFKILILPKIHVYNRLSILYTDCDAIGSSPTNSG